MVYFVLSKTCRECGQLVLLVLITEREKLAQSQVRLSPDISSRNMKVWNKSKGK